MSLLDSLNPAQREAATTLEGPLLVIAGAGSGKTKMLTSRIAHLIQSGHARAHEVLAVTFTNKAAAEMRERVEKSLLHEGGGYLGRADIGTFHALCVRWLRRELPFTPFSGNFVIYDDSDQLSMIKEVVRKMGLDEKSFSPKGFQAAINRAKCDALSYEDIQPAPHNLFEKHLKTVYELYQKSMEASNAIDFGEILCLMERIFRNNPEVRARYQKQYRYIHVDEYQDTNRAQYLLLSWLAKPEHGGHGNLCVVGDEDQSIYKWRGADIRNILEFETDYPNAKIVKLEQNYRSTQTILAAANHVIKNNQTRKPKTLWTENERGAQITRVSLSDERAEAEMVISEIMRLAADDGYSYKDFAIFYRTHAQSRQFEDTLRREKITYDIVGGLKFYERKEIKDILAYFKVATNPRDTVSLKRIIQCSGRGIGKTTIEKIEALNAPTFYDALRYAASNPDVTTKGTAKKLGAFAVFVERLIQSAQTAPTSKPSELFHWILDATGYVSELKLEGTEEAMARIENLEEMDSMLQEFEEDQETTPEADLLSLFLEQTSLVSEADALSKTTGAEEKIPSVQMMSLHASKGLEFPVVFLAGMEEGLFPSVRPWSETGQEDEELEEERRLCYVGITRARQRLYLSHVQMRRIWGQVSMQEPARFFNEIPDELIEFRDLSYGSGASSYRLGSSKHFQTASASNVIKGVVGKTFAHPDYGKGRIIASEGMGHDQKVTVEFLGRDQRKFLYRFIRELVEE